MNLWRKQAPREGSGRSPWSRWPVLLSAGCAAALTTYAITVALDLVTFDCSIEVCAADGYPMLTPVALVLAGAMAFPEIGGWKRLALPTSVVVVGGSGAAWIAWIATGPPGPEKSFVLWAMASAVLILGIPLGWLLGLAGGWFGARVRRDGLVSVHGRICAGLLAAGSAALVISAWTPWVTIDGVYLLNGMEVALAGKVLVACGVVAGLTGAGLLMASSARLAALPAAVAALVAAGAVVWVLTSRHVFLAAHRPRFPGQSQVPLRAADLGPGVPIPLLAAFVMLGASILLLRVAREASAPVTQGAAPRPSDLS